MAHPYVNDLRARFGLDLDLGLEEGVEMPYEPWLRQMLVRRTHRRYLDQPVSDAIVRLLLYRNFAHMGNYREAVQLAQETGTTPDITKVEHRGNVKYGFTTGL